jgi:hypothetical protein
MESDGQEDGAAWLVHADRGRIIVGRVAIDSFFIELGGVIYIHDLV